MRFKIAALLVLLLGATPGISGRAEAAISVGLVWTSTTGSGTPGGASIDAAPGDQLVAELRVTADAGGVGIYAVSVEFDTDLANELNLVSVIELFPPEMQFNLTTGVGSTQESTAGQKGNILTFEAVTLTIPGPTSGTMVAGLLTFDVTANVASDGADLFTGEFNVRIDGVGNNANMIVTPVYLGASVNQATVGTFSISGHITDLNSNPLAGITVEASGYTTTTNSQGNYVLGGLPAGTYTVHPSGGGYTFGSAQFQIDNNTRSLSASTPTAIVNAIGYNRPPIVYVHGWTGGTSDLNPYPNTLVTAGYAKFFAALQTTLLFTPPMGVNAGNLRDEIDDAKYTTGQDKVILMAHSMGGIVSRSYLETWRYNGDVSEVFTFGSPHRGIPAVSHIACLPNQPAVCEMTQAGMILFNLTHWKRKSVEYHEIGGDAPMWTTKPVCIKLLGRKRCVYIPWPDSTFRNGSGFAMGALILGPDDGFIHTCSSIGQTSLNLDRFVTREVHSGGLGPRTYFRWDGAISQESYGQCVQRTLVSASPIHTCGTRKSIFWCLPPILGSLTAGPSGTLSAPATSAGIAQRAAPLIGTIDPGETISRSVVVEGGGTTFSVELGEGTAAFHLVDPTGQTIDPSYVATIMDGSPTDPDAEITTVVAKETVAYMSDGGGAQYYFPNARKGTWQVIALANGDVPIGGTSFASEVIFDSPFVVEFAADSLFLTPETTANFTLQLPPVASASVSMSISLPSGGDVPLSPTPSGGGVYTAAWIVPDDSGYARLSWSVTGTRADGVAFERGGYEDFQITSTQLAWNGVLAETSPPRPGDPTLFQSLVLDAGVDSGYAGLAQVSADLVDGFGEVVAHANESPTLVLGTNTVALTFAGDDIYASGLDGPYTLTNVVLADARGALILAAQADNDYETATYEAGDFASAHDAPSVTTTGPYAGFSGESIDLAAIGADPEGDSLTYAWDLDDDGSFETSGQNVQYSAPLVSQTTSTSVKVRVTDTSANSATAETFIDVSPITPGSPVDGQSHEITINKPQNGGPPGSTGVQVVPLAPPDADAIACGYQVILEPGTTGGLAGGPSNWSDVVVFYDSTAGCAAACPSGVADTILLISDSSADPDAVLSEAAIGAACAGLTSAEIQGGVPGSPTPAGVPEGSIDGYEHTVIAASSGGAISTITITNAGSFLLEILVPMLSPWALVLIVAGLLVPGARSVRARRRRSPTT